MKQFNNLAETIQWNPCVSINTQNEQISHKKLQETVFSLKVQMEQCGLTKGSKVCILLDHSLKSLKLLLALIDLKCCFLPIDSKNTVEEIKQILKMTDFDVLIATSSDDNNNECLSIQPRLLILNYDLNSKNTYITKSHSNEGIEEPYFYQLTSGSTGKPKIAMIPYHALFIGAEYYSKLYKMTPNDKIVCTVPIYHSFGLIGSLIGTLFSGGTFYYCNKPNPRNLIELIKEVNATILFAPPVIFNLIGKSKKIVKQDFTSLRFGISSGGVLQEKLVNELFKSKKLRVLQVYGSTETGLIAAENPDKKKQHPSVGFLPPHVKVKINEEGRVCVKSSTLFKGYVNNQSAKFSHDYFITGDLAVIKDEEIIIKGRISDFINVGGRKINVVEIKNTILSHPHVNNVKVNAIEDDVKEQRIQAVVEIKKENSLLNEQSLREYLKTRISLYKIPHEIVFKDNLENYWK